ncbi:MAG: hypothetical protein ABIE43_03835 [Patescibacteria group bacterium]
MKNLVGLKELRQNITKYAEKVSQGSSFIILKKSKPLFKICPIENEEKWEVITDFTKIKKGGIDIDEVLARL